DCILAAGVGSNICSFPTKVPLGKELVIEFISIEGVVPDNLQEFTEFDVATVAGSVGVTHHFPPVPISHAFTSFTSEMVRIYADPNTSILLVAVRDVTSGSALASATLSGYLVNLP